MLGTKTRRSLQNDGRGVASVVDSAKKFSTSLSLSVSHHGLPENGRSRAEYRQHSYPANERTTPSARKRKDQSESDSRKDRQHQRYVAARLTATEAPYARAVVCHLFLYTNTCVRSDFCLLHDYWGCDDTQKHAILSLPTAAKGVSSIIYSVLSRNR